jgi:ABC-type lipoprotein release transport system permease subunit
MSMLRYITASLRQYRRVHLAVAAGVAVATAVITGALLVGDSVRGSLRDLVLERLANIDAVLVAEQPFRADLASDLANSIKDHQAQVTPLLLIPGSISATQDGGTQQATQLSIMGVSDDFWKLGETGPAIDLDGDEAVITQAIADELHAKIGDEVLLRVAIPSNIPADSTLGEKADATTVRRLTVKAIRNTGIARFSLQPSQLEPRNVFVPLSTLQRMLDIRGKANVIAVGSENRRLVESRLSETFKPQLADFGLLVEEVSIGEPPANRYVQLSAERLVLAPYVVELFEKLFVNFQPQEVVTYLANTINLGDKKIPYSTVTGIDSTSELGPLRDEAGQPVVLTDNEIALNDWAAEQLNAKVGDSVTLKYYEPETTHGELVERTTEPLTVKLIAPLKSSEGEPTAAADERLGVAVQTG